MATELLTCDDCGRDWVRKITRGAGPAPDVCPDCARRVAACAPRVGTPATSVTDRRRHDVDIPIAFASVDVRSAVKTSLTPRPALCPWCSTEWLADHGTTNCPACASSDGRVVVDRPASRTATPAAPSSEPPPEISLEADLVDVPGVGPALARRVSERWPTLDDLAAVAEHSVTDLPGVGIALARRLVEYARVRLGIDQPDDVLGGFDHPFDLLDGPSPFHPAPTPVEYVTTGEQWTDALHVLNCIVCDRYHLDVLGRVEFPLCPACDTGGTSGYHGLKGALKGCRCGKCLAALARGRGWANARVAGATLQQLGDDAGISRERVRQITEKVDPSRPWDAAATVDRLERAEVDRVAGAALAHARAAAADPCPTCGGPVTPGANRRFCSGDCRERFAVLRYHIDDDRRDSHRILMARWTLDHEDEASDIQIRYAHRVLAGTAVHNDDRRWLIEGSEPFKVAVEAVVNGWPLAELLPDSVRRQVEEHLGMHVTDWSEVLTVDVLEEHYVERYKTPSGVAQTFGCPLDEVYAAFDRHGIPLRSATGSTSPYADVLTPEFLEREYVHNGRSGPDIAREVGCGAGAVYAALNRHGISRRLPVDSPYADVLTEEFLRREYVDNDRSARSIAEEAGCWSVTVQAALRRHGIPVREAGGGAGLPGTWVDVLTEEFLRREYVEAGRSGTDIAEEIGCGKNAVYAALRRHGFPIREGVAASGAGRWVDVLTEEFLRREYVDNDRSGTDIADEVGCDKSAVYDALRRHGLPVREGAEGGGIPSGTWVDVLTDEYLQREYVEGGRSGTDIADEVGCARSAVYDALRRHDIPVRQGGAAGMLGDRQSWEGLLTAEFLEREYVKAGKSGNQIADEVGCSPSVVYSWLDRHGIDKRPPRSEQELPYTEEWLRDQYLDEGRPASELAAEVGLSVPGLYAALRKYGIRRDEQVSRARVTEDLLRREYVDNGRSVRDIADELGVNKVTVYAALRRHGIETRGRTNDYDDVLTREFLVREYVHADRTGTDIADQVGCDKTTVYAALHRHGVAKGDAALTRDFLVREHAERGRSVDDIAATTGHRRDDIDRALHRHGIRAGSL